MTLTQKEIDTLAMLNKKALVYEYAEVKAIVVGGIETTVNKLQKIGAKAKKVNKANTAELSDLTMAQITDMDEARRLKARKNNL